MMRFLVLSFWLVFQMSCIGQEKINWMPFDETAFEKAQKEDKPIHLYLQANWCHWCHVMEDSTYHNPSVIKYLNENFICVKADQDARPDLANKYRDYGWPALIFYTSEGEEMVKRAGYIAPDLFQKLLKAIVKDPSPEKVSFEAKADIADNDLKMVIENNLVNSLDIEVGGFDQAQKYVAFSTFEYCLLNASDVRFSKWLNSSIQGSFGLNDPVWGGVYQYSTHYDWQHVHFEKLLTIQARYMKMYVQYDAVFGSDSTIEKAKKIDAYVSRFLSSASGGFYNSQDADIIAGVHSEAYFEKNNKERLKEGIPRIDSNVFTSNSARYAEALIYLWAVTGEEKYLAKSEQALVFLSQRVSNDGQVPHQKKVDLLYAEDFLYLAEALLSLSKVNEEPWILKNVDSILTTGIKKFQNAEGLFNSFIGENGLLPEPLVGENIHLARVYHQAGGVLGKPQFKNVARNIFEALRKDDFAREVSNEPAYLLLEHELESTHYEASFVVKEENDLMEVKRKLLALGKSNVIINTYSLNDLPEDKKELFGGIGFSALFFCTDTYCSSPITSVDELMIFLERN